MKQVTKYFYPIAEAQGLTTVGLGSISICDLINPYWLQKTQNMVWEAPTAEAWLESNGSKFLRQVKNYSVNYRILKVYSTFDIIPLLLLLYFNCPEYNQSRNHKFVTSASAIWRSEHLLSSFCLYISLVLLSNLAFLRRELNSENESSILKKYWKVYQCFYPWFFT